MDLLRLRGVIPLAQADGLAAAAGVSNESGQVPSLMLVDLGQMAAEAVTSALRRLYSDWLAQEADAAAPTDAEVAQQACSVLFNMLSERQISSFSAPARSALILGGPGHPDHDVERVAPTAALSLIGYKAFFALQHVSGVPRAQRQPIKPTRFTPGTQGHHRDGALLPAKHAHFPHVIRLAEFQHRDAYLQLPQLLATALSLPLRSLQFASPPPQIAPGGAIVCGAPGITLPAMLTWTRAEPCPCLVASSDSDIACYAWAPSTLLARPASRRQLQSAFADAAPPPQPSTPSRKTSCPPPCRWLVYESGRVAEQLRAPSSVHLAAAAAAQGTSFDRPQFGVRLGFKPLLQALSSLDVAALQWAAEHPDERAAELEDVLDRTQWCAIGSIAPNARKVLQVLVTGHCPLRPLPQLRTAISASSGTLAVQIGTDLIDLDASDRPDAEQRLAPLMARVPMRVRRADDRSVGDVVWEPDDGREGHAGQRLLSGASHAVRLFHFEQGPHAPLLRADENAATVQPCFPAQPGQDTPVAALDWAGYRAALPQSYKDEENKAARSAMINSTAAARSDAPASAEPSIDMRSVKTQMYMTNSILAARATVTRSMPLAKALPPHLRSHLRTIVLVGRLQEAHHTSWTQAILDSANDLFRFIGDAEKGEALDTVLAVLSSADGTAALLHGLSDALQLPHAARQMAAASAEEGGAAFAPRRSARFGGAGEELEQRWTDEIRKAIAAGLPPSEVISSTSTTTQAQIRQLAANAVRSSTLGPTLAALNRARGEATIVPAIAEPARAGAKHQLLRSAASAMRRTCGERCNSFLTDLVEIFVCAPLTSTIPDVRPDGTTMRQLRRSILEAIMALDLRTLHLTSDAALNVLKMARVAKQWLRIDGEQISGPPGSRAARHCAAMQQAVDSLRQGVRALHDLFAAAADKTQLDLTTWPSLRALSTAIYAGTQDDSSWQDEDDTPSAEAAPQTESAPGQSSGSQLGTNQAAASSELQTPQQAAVHAHEAGEAGGAGEAGEAGEEDEEEEEEQQEESARASTGPIVLVAAVAGAVRALGLELGELCLTPSIRRAEVIDSRGRSHGKSPGSLFGSASRILRSAAAHFTAMSAGRGDEQALAASSVPATTGGKTPDAGILNDADIWAHPLSPQSFLLNDALVQNAKELDAAFAAAITAATHEFQQAGLKRVPKESDGTSATTSLHRYGYGYWCVNMSQWACQLDVDKIQAHLVPRGMVVDGELCRIICVHLGKVRGRRKIWSESNVGPSVATMLRSSKRGECVLRMLPTWQKQALGKLATRWQIAPLTSTTASVLLDRMAQEQGAAEAAGRYITRESAAFLAHVARQRESRNSCKVPERLKACAPFYDSSEPLRRATITIDPGYRRTASISATVWVDGPNGGDYTTVTSSLTRAVRLHLASMNRRRTLRSKARVSASSVPGRQDVHAAFSHRATKARKKAKISSDKISALLWHEIRGMLARPASLTSQARQDEMDHSVTTDHLIIPEDHDIMVVLCAVHGLGRFGRN